MMRKNEIEVGGTYLAKVGARNVEVKVEGENPKGGWNCIAVATGKPVRVKDAKNLRPSKGGSDDAATGDAETATDATAEVEQSVPADESELVPLTQLDREKKKSGGKAKGKARAEKAPKEKKAKAAKPPKEKKPKKLSALDAAVQVLTAAKEPMRCKDMVAAMKEKGLWTTNAPTPEATLYSAILRELSKGKDSRFRKTERGHFALKD